MWNIRLQKIFTVCLLAVTPVSFAQIYRGEAEAGNEAIVISIHFVEYGDYRYLFHINGVSIFLDEDNIAQLKAALEKFGAWEAIATEGQISLTRTIDSITFTSFHFNRIFFRETLIFYFVFTGGPAVLPGPPRQAVADDAEGNSDASGDPPPARYTLFVDTTLEAIPPFRLSSKGVQELLDALSPEKLADAQEIYERQRALEELFN
jgi:hypothetical protein